VSTDLDETKVAAIHHPNVRVIERAKFRVWHIADILGRSYRGRESAAKRTFMTFDPFSADDPRGVSSLTISPRQAARYSAQLSIIFWRFSNTSERA